MNSIDNKKKNLLSVLIIGLLIFITFKFLMQFLWPIMVVIVFISNRDWIKVAIKYIQDKLKENIFIGAALILLSIILLAPITIFLLLRTLYFAFFENYDEDQE